MQGENRWATGRENSGRKPQHCVVPFPTEGDDSDTAPHRAANQAMHCREPRSENCLAKGDAEAQGGRGEIIDSFWHLPQKVGSPDRS